MTDANKVMHPQYFGTHPTDIQIRINPNIWNRILDYFVSNFGMGDGGILLLSAIVSVTDVAGASTK